MNISGETWQVYGLLCLAVLALAALGFDLKYRRIPNWLVMVGLLLGVVINVVGPQAGARVAGLFSDMPAAQGLGGAIKGAGLAFLMLIPFYMLRVMGAGDVKLMMAIGALLGPMPVMNVILFVFLIAGLIALGFFVFKIGLLESIRQLFVAVTTKNTDSLLKISTKNTAWRMPFSVPVGLGLIAYSIWIFSGNWPII